MVMFGLVLIEPYLAIDVKAALNETATFDGNPNRSLNAMASLSFIVGLRLKDFPAELTLTLLFFNMVNEFAPIFEKLSFIDFLRPSIEVNIPTSAIIPIEIIRAVKVVRSKFPLMAINAIFICCKRSTEFDLSPKIKKPHHKEGALTNIVTNLIKPQKSSRIHKLRLHLDL
jgi:hypothetical protein